MSFVTYTIIGIGIVILIAGSIIKYITGKKVDDLDGLIGIIDETDYDDKKE